MEEDAARNSLFGSAASRNAGKSNPYSNPSPPAERRGEERAGEERSGEERGGETPEEKQRKSLLAGGKPRSSTAVAVSVVESKAPEPMPEVADDGMIQFDFENLNLLEASGLGSGDSLSIEELDFAAIDEDLSKFAQDEVIREALSKGVDLRVYSRQVDSELRHMEMLSIEDYVNESDAIAELFEQINSCEGVLTDMQRMLKSFQDNLGGISEEIHDLQQRSLSLSVQMDNRKALVGKINTFLAKVSVPEQLVLRIVDGAVDEAWLKDLKDLSEKISFATGAAPTAAEDYNSSAAGSFAHHTSPADTAAGRDTSLADLTISPLHTPVGRESLPQVEKLKIAACSKLRGFFTRAIGELIRPKTNMSKQQEYILLKYAPAMMFLNEHGGEIGREVRSLYADQVGRYYAGIFKKYHEDLFKMLLALPTKADTLADYNPQARHQAAVIADPSLSGVAHPLVDPFALGERLHILAQVDAPAVPAHIAQGEKTRFTFEAVWRHLVRHLMDVSMSEFSFGRKFFGEHLGAEMFTLTMSGALSSLLAALEEHLLQSGDAPGLLLLVALTAAQRRSMNEKRCEILESFFDRVTLLLWPHFKMALDENAKSLRRAKENPKKYASADFNAHFITKRYAEFQSSILVLHRRLDVVHLSDGMLVHHLTALTKEWDALLQRLAGELSKAAKIVFMINNYSACLATGQSKAVDADDLVNWDRGADHYMNMYTESELETYFRSLVAFVKKWESAAQAAAAASHTALVPNATGEAVPAVPTIANIPDSVAISVDLGETEAVLRDFNANWRNGIKSIADNINRFFAASTAGLTVVILKRVLGSFINHYERFTTLLARGVPSTHPVLREMVNLQTIYFEMRKYSRMDAM